MGLGRQKGDGEHRPSRWSHVRAQRDVDSAASLALRVLILFGLFAVLWALASHSILRGLFDTSVNDAVQNAVEFVIFIAATGVILFAAVWSIANKLIEARGRLRDSERELVQRLGQAAEWRDDETGDHTVRVGEYCAAIAHSYGWSADQCAAIRVAGMLHDIGKIGIPDFVMVKSGSLSAEERQLIQAHTLMGSDILADSQIPLLQMAQKIAASHHEKWDGSGYPYALVAEEIPLEGRIAALADVFDALTSRRRYKGAWTFEKAVEEIVSLSGTHFDPEVVKAFVKAIPTMRGIYDRFQSTARSFNISRAA